MARGRIFGLGMGEILILGLAVCFVYIGGFQGTVLDLWNNLGLSSVTSGGNYKGNIQFVILPQDCITAAVAAPTNDVVVYFKDQPSGSGAAGTSLTYAGTTMEAEGDGECWLAFYAGQEWYLAEDKLLSMNPGKFKAGSAFWADLDNNNTPDYCIAVDTSDVGVTGQAQTPVMTITMPLLEDDIGITCSDPADVTALAVETVTPLTFNLAAIAADDGTVISRLYFTVNQTYASGFCKPEELTLSGGWVGGGGQSYWNAPVKIVEGTTSYYYYTTGDPDYAHSFNGERYWVKTGEPTTCYATVNVRTKLAAVAGPGGHAIITMYIETVQNQGTLTMVNSGGTDMVSH